MDVVLKQQSLNGTSFQSSYCQHLHITRSFDCFFFFMGLSLAVTLYVALAGLELLIFLFQPRSAGIVVVHCCTQAYFVWFWTFVTTTLFCSHFHWAFYVITFNLTLSISFLLPPLESYSVMFALIAGYFAYNYRTVFLINIDTKT
jgi:hypothetical protein